MDIKKLRDMITELEVIDGFIMDDKEFLFLGNDTLIIKLNICNELRTDLKEVLRKHKKRIEDKIKYERDD